MAFSGPSYLWGPTSFSCLWKSKPILISDSFYSNSFNIQKKTIGICIQQNLEVQEDKENQNHNTKSTAGRAKTWYVPRGISIVLVICCTESWVERKNKVPYLPISKSFSFEHQTHLEHEMFLETMALFWSG